MDPVARTYQYMDERARKRVEAFTPRDPRFNPSSISKCARRLAYKHHNVQPEFREGSGFLSQYGPAGDYFHDHIRFEMRDAGVEFNGLKFDDRNRTVYELDAAKVTITHNDQEITLSGRGDGRIMVDGVEYYNEIKSVDAYKYRWMLDAYQKGTLEKYLRNQWDSYIQQCNMMCSPEMLDLPGTYLVIANRSNCQFGFCDKNFENREGGMVLKFDPEMWEMQKNKMAMIERMTAAGEFPMQGYTEGSKDCGQCDYEGRCWG